MLTDVSSSFSGSPEAIVVGGSLGVVEALGVLLPAVRRETRVAVVVVVHVPARRPSMLADLFRPRCAVPVLEVEDKQPVTPGTIWFAPSDYHVSIERDRTFSLSVEPPVWHSRPSIDVLFESAAEVYRERLVAVVLTGANEDGADGSRAVHDAGGFVIVQAPSDAIAQRMPRAAIERAAPQLVASLDRIAESLSVLTWVQA